MHVVMDSIGLGCFYIKITEHLTCDDRDILSDMAGEFFELF